MLPANNGRFDCVRFFFFIMSSSSIYTGPKSEVFRDVAITASSEKFADRFTEGPKITSLNSYNMNYRGDNTMCHWIV
ncbi:hypothetical protein RCL_jg22413.t1 [Rhizophagus clarus]|uniref:Uncharacterized protein n=1 Tax=Rhizophagus clarus TaxID=94130 RepID=A0A8H3R473_9GLOM|nr:hypothetical protein RCL_jg22413.t1 [Rhizophagus clarus]